MDFEFDTPPLCMIGLNPAALMMKYNELCQRMKANKAIIRITRKLISRICYVLKHQKVYQIGVVS